MEDLLEQIEAALNADLYYAALFTSLTIPDICGALESNDGKANSKKYKEWFDKWVKENESDHLTGEVCYYYRCAILHQGRADHPQMPFNRIIFVEPNDQFWGHKNLLTCETKTGKVIEYMIDVKEFCLDIIKACRKWLIAKKSDPTVQKNLTNSLKRYPFGTETVGGMPVIA